MLNECYIGDCIDGLRAFADAGISARVCVTSPPYWGLRDYGVEGAFGLEETFDEWLDRMVETFELVRNVLTDDGTLWLNLGDSYANDGKWGGETGGKQAYLPNSDRKRCGREKRRTGLQPKNLIGQPWRLALALQAAGWNLRQDIIWHKPAPMPESVRDRCTKAHEYLFLLSKSQRYHFDQTAISEEASPNTHARVARHKDGQGSDRAHDGTKLMTPSESVTQPVSRRNKRSVWTIPAEPYSEAHFATFPRKLVEPCILAGSAPGDVVLDPFMGSGTTAQVAESLSRQWIGCEINPEYVALQADRLRQQNLDLASEGRDS